METFIHRLMKRLKKLLKTVFLISFIEELFDPELGYDADTFRLDDLHHEFAKRIKYDESEFAAKVWSFYRIFILRGDWSSPEMKEAVRSIKPFGKELGRLFRLFRKEYPGNEFRWTRKEFNAELCAEALINFMKKHESELSSEFVNYAIEEQNELKQYYERINNPPKRTKEEQAEIDKKAAEWFQKLQEDQLRFEMKLEQDRLRKEERRKEYEATHSSETAFQRFKTIFYATIKLFV